MITVVWSPKGGQGKTPLVRQLSYFLPTNTKFLDLDFNEGLSELMDLKQPRPRKITESFIEEFLKEFYDNERHLIVDCGGFPTDPILATLARGDHIVTPLLNIKTTQKTPLKLAETLKDISEQIDYQLKAKVLWTATAWNASVDKLNSLLPSNQYLQPLSFAIAENSKFKNGEKTDSERVTTAMKKLVKEISYVEE